MRFALLGFDPLILPLAEAIARSPRHELVATCDLGPQAERVQAIAPGARHANHWEALLDGSDVDAVVVAGDGSSEVRADQLRKFLQVDMPLIVSHPQPVQSLVCYELEMIREEHHGVLLPYLPGRWHPSINRLCEPPASDLRQALGELEQITLERAMAHRDKVATCKQFARDVDLARALCGELTRLSAMVPQGADDYDNLGVQLSSASGVLIRWCVGPVDRQAGAALCLHGTRGQVTLDMPEGGTWRRVVEIEGRRDEQVFDDWQPAETALDRLEQAIAGSDLRPSWTDACRAVELAETIDRSIARGRTIELRPEAYDDEEANFRGTMAAVGCGLLLLTFFIGVLAALFAAFGVSLPGWPYFLVTLMVMFLLLQSLGLIIPKRSPKTPANMANADAESKGT